MPTDEPQGRWNRFLDWLFPLRAAQRDLAEAARMSRLLVDGLYPIARSNQQLREDLDQCAQQRIQDELTMMNLRTQLRGQKDTANAD